MMIAGIDVMFTHCHHWAPTQDMSTASGDSYYGRPCLAIPFALFSG